jgi:hypothetical protein
MQMYLKNHTIFKERARVRAHLKTSLIITSRAWLHALTDFLTLQGSE